MSLVHLLLLILGLGLIVWGVQFFIANVPGIPAWVKGLVIGLLLVIVGLWLIGGDSGIRL